MVRCRTLVSCVPFTRTEVASSQREGGGEGWLPFALGRRTRAEPMQHATAPTRPHPPPASHPSPAGPPWGQAASALVGMKSDGKVAEADVAAMARLVARPPLRATQVQG